MTEPAGTLDLDMAVALMWATTNYPNDLELGLRNWADMGGNALSQERAEFEIAAEPLLAEVRSLRAELEAVRSRAFTDGVVSAVNAVNKANKTPSRLRQMTERQT